MYSAIHAMLDESSKRTLRRPWWLALTSLVALAAFALTGCGSEDEHDNAPRPPAVIAITAYVGDNDFTVSPRSFGAGAVRFVATNQRSDRVRIDVEGDQLSRTININPNDTANSKFVLDEGVYTVSVTGVDLPIELDVGPPRESAQQELLQP